MKTNIIIDPNRRENNTAGGRLYFLDNLRAGIILLVILLHTAVSYVSPAFPGWVHNTRLSPLFWLIVIPLQSSILMPAMFFIAGYFTMPSLAGKGGKNFIRGKLIRLGIPYVMGVVILAPLLEHLSAAADGKQEGLFPRFRVFFQPQNFSQYHFWFLGVLLFFFLIVFVLYSIFGRKIIPAGVKTEKPAPGLLLLFFCGTGLARFAADILFTTTDINSQWVRIYVIQFEIMGAPLYIAFFLLGIAACSKGWFAGGYKARVFPPLLVFIASSMAAVMLLTVFAQASPINAGLRFFLDFSICAGSMSFLGMLLAIFAKYFNKDSRAQSITGSSYGVYLIHANILFVILFLSRDLALPPGLKFLAQFAVTAAASWMAGYALKKLPVIKKVL
jgi:glucan biosynthesis protein C